MYLWKGGEIEGWNCKSFTYSWKGDSAYNIKYKNEYENEDFMGKWV